MMKKVQLKFRTMMFLALTFLIATFVSAQDISITGNITDLDGGATLPGANIVVKGTTTGTITGSDGNYSITAPSDGILVFSFVGYSTQEIQIGGRNVINVVMEVDIGKLEEVMVIGYGTVKKKDVTGSIVNVKTDDLADRPANSVTDALQGRVAGVTVINNGGSPAEPPTIRIRGNSTLNSEGPLWIVDGIVNDNGVDPSEIESITILKDASAAIYGTRASAGVILVTTKSGKKGLKVDLDVKYGWGTPWKMMDVLDAAGYCDIYTTMYQNAGQPIPQVFSDSYFRTTRTDWLDAVFQTGVTQNYSLTVSGGGEKSTFSLFTNWKNLEGTLHNTYSKTGRIRIKSDHKIADFLTLGENISITTGRSRGANTTSGYSGVILGSVYYPPSAKIWSDEANGIYSGVIDPNDVDLSLAGQFGDLYNPYALLDRDNDYNPNINTLVNLYGIIDIIDGLKFKSNFSYNYNQTYYKDFRERILEPGKVYDYNRLYTSAGVGHSMVTEQLLTYEKTFNSHSITALAGYAAEEYESEDFSIAARDFPIEDEWAQEYVNAGDFDTDRPSSGYGKNSLISMFGRLAYSYSDKYYLTGVFRRDGTSKVIKENRWGIFPSVSAAWRVSEESFLKDVEILSDLKIRASWGKMGNINPLGNYETAVPLSLSNRILFGAVPIQVTSYYMNGISNPDLKWETTTTTDVGFDALLLNNRLSVSFDYYNKTVTDMLVKPDLIYFAGVGSSPWVNAGETLNKGYELMIGWRNVINDFKYDISLNLAHNTNELVKYRDDKDFEIHGDHIRSVLYPLRSEVGQPFRSYYLIENDGIFQTDQEAIDYVDSEGNRIQPNAEAGDLKFVDRNNDGQINAEDKRFCGDYFPDFTYGINISLSYKNWDCSMFLQGVQNVDIFTGYKFSTYQPPGQGYNLLADANNAWSTSNTGSDIPRLNLVDYNNNYGTESDWYLKDGSYLRLKNFTLGYTLPENLLTMIGTSKLRVFFTSQNLLTFTKYEGFDPEVGESGLDMLKYPQSRTFMFGANISF